jgi:hypothetical protein
MVAQAAEFANFCCQRSHLQDKTPPIH